MKILVTGGAGYIGGVTVERLRAKGEQVVVLDDLVRGHRAALDKDVPFYQGRVGDRGADRAHRRRSTRSKHAFISRRFAYVGESVAEPAKYFENNVEQGVAFMGSLLKAGMRRVVFSSTCATYGEPEQMPISETCPQWPKNPYGWSKFTMERLLESYDHAYGLKFVALRYFNAVGRHRIARRISRAGIAPGSECSFGRFRRMPEVAVFGQELSDSRWNLHPRLRSRGRSGGCAHSRSRISAQGRQIGFHQSGNGPWLFGAGSDPSRAKE